MNGIGSLLFSKIGFVISGVEPSGYVSMSLVISGRSIGVFLWNQVLPQMITRTTSILACDNSCNEQLSYYLERGWFPHKVLSLGLPENGINEACA